MKKNIIFQMVLIIIMSLAVIPLVSSQGTCSCTGACNAQGTYVITRTNDCHSGYNPLCERGLESFKCCGTCSWYFPVTGCDCIGSGTLDSCYDAAGTASGRDAVCAGINPATPNCCGTGATAHCEACCNTADCGTGKVCASWACVSGAVCGNGKVEGTEQCDGGLCCKNDCTFYRSTMICRDSTAACDPAEYCTGSSRTCPADIDNCGGGGAVCGNGVKETGEACDGGACCTSSCTFRPNTFTCRASAGICDPAESCTGSSALCPSDAKSSSQCRASAGVCDLAESCDGVSNACPADIFSSGNVCRASAGACDLAESCTGSGAICPVNVFQLAGVSCGDSLWCNGDETCDGLGTCQSSSRICSDGKPCTTDSCDEGIDQCVYANTCVSGCDGTSGYTFTGACLVSGCERVLAATEVCTDNLDNDCDGAIDGCDSDCPEGSGSGAASIYRCCNDGLDNDGDGLMDLDDTGCCDLATPPRGFYDPTNAVSGIGVDCGDLDFKFENLMPGMKENCCGGGEGNSEYFITTTIGANDYSACCSDSTDCVDSNGNCQLGVENTFALCIDVEDNDCDGNINAGDADCTGTLYGYVFNEQGYPLAKATVKGSPPAIGTQYESTSAPTQIEGRYTLSNAFISSYNFIARREGYDDNITLLTINSGGNYYVNFTLRNGSCHADCTDYYGNCNPACEGLVFTDSSGQQDTCSFISPLCHYRPKGFRATEMRIEPYYDQHTPDTEQEMIYEYKCCEGEGTPGGFRKYPAISPRLSGDFDSLYDYVTNVKFGGRYVKLHIAIASPKK